jgi:hypothetical protein
MGLSVQTTLNSSEYPIAISIVNAGSADTPKMHVVVNHFGSYDRLSHVTERKILRFT